MDGEQLKSARLSLGLTKGRAAFYFGVDSRTWRRWETGQREITKSTQILLTLCVKYPFVWKRVQDLVGDEPADLIVETTD